MALAKPIQATDVYIDLPDRQLRVRFSDGHVTNVQERADDTERFGDIGSGWTSDPRIVHPAICFDEEGRPGCVCGLEEMQLRPDWHPSYPTLKAV